MYSGGSFKEERDFVEVIRNYFTSTIFIAVVSAMILSKIDIPEDHFTATIQEELKTVQCSLAVISAIILGQQLSFQPMKGLWALITFSIFIQMLFQVCFCSAVSNIPGVNHVNRDILVLSSAMPAALPGPVFATQYDCAARTATLLTFTHIVISPVVVPVVFTLFP
ncbi:MAG TPA: AEC family transporter [Desulfomonilia bacterium]